MLISTAFVLSAQNPANEKELKKQADKRYNDDEFTEAYPLYAQLVANYPKDPLFNFRLGVCMIYSEDDKKKCLNYLKAVDPNAKDCPKELFFYLGKAYHINYLFDEALKHYQTFKEKASPSLQKKLQVEREMEACNNGKKLLSNLTDISVRSKKQLNEADYFRTYDLKGLGGKLLVKPEEFRTAVDKKKKERSIVFLPKGSNVVFFSSYGENGANGKDLFSCFKQADGTFSKPVALMGINTGYDEDYPFLHPDGKTLYFASKGFNSMGGYDIFKSVYDSASSTWSSPQNLEFPINSPDDDFLFVTDSLEQTAFFSTGRQSPPGKIDVLKINIARKPLDVIAVKGKVEAEKEGQALNSKIMIKYLNSVRMVGEFEANEEGQFQLQIPNGENLVYTVETPGLSTQSETLIIPKAELARPCRQIIAYQNGKLKISTTFDEGQGEDNYLQYLKVIEEKAKLDVNAEDKSPEPLTKANASENQGPRKKSDGPQIIEQSGPAAANPNNLKNKELAQLVKKDAQQAASQHQQLNQDARDAYKLSGEFSSSYSKKYEEAQTAISNAEAMEEGADKTQAIEMANALKQDAEQDKLLADKILLYGKSLEEDAKTVKLSSDLNNEFASALNKSKSSNIGADPVLSDLQMKVINAENKSGSELYANELRKEISDKEDQIRETDNAIAENTKGTEDLKTEIASLENQLASAKKKSLKENLNNQIGDLRTEQTEKEKQAQELLTQKTNLEKDLVLLKKENDVLLRIRNENPAAPPAPLVADPATSPLALRDKYSPRIAIVDANDAESYKLSNTALNDYNLEIDALINAKKKESARSRNAKTKQQFAGEIRQLENQKRSNQQQISKNEYLLESLKKQARQEEAIALDFTPINTGNGPE
ncbi:MAG TPA: hypothetical protein PLQ93_09660, partial [Bacteroidia bacterium]|nr:hypothetical protein [Bacteroidia bacterium]